MAGYRSGISHRLAATPLQYQPESTKTDSTWQERATADYLRGAWAAFAAWPIIGLIFYGWSTFAPGNNTDALVGLGMGDQGCASTLLPSLGYDGLHGCASMPSISHKHVTIIACIVTVSRHARQLSASRNHEVYNFQAEPHGQMVHGRQ